MSRQGSASRSIRFAGVPWTVAVIFMAATLGSLSVATVASGAVSAPTAASDRPQLDTASVAARMCNTMLRKLGFETFQQRFSSPERCPDALMPDAHAAIAECEHVADPVACIEARTAAAGGEETTGSTYTTTSGSDVRVVVARGYDVDEAQRLYWAEFLDSLVHGVELSAVTLHLAPPAEISALCGPGALACYQSETATIVAAAGDQPGAPSAHSLVAHEYGHHIASSQHALDTGTRRWATYMHICQRVRARELVMRATWGLGYRLDPAEGFAEAYRVLNERRLGRAEAPWMLVDPRFDPDATALRALEQDVRERWRTPGVMALRGHGDRTFFIPTPVDGALQVSISSPRGTYRVSAPTEVCGQRRVAVKVRHVRGYGAYTLRVSRP